MTARQDVLEFYKANSEEKKEVSEDKNSNSLHKAFNLFRVPFAVFCSASYLNLLRTNLMETLNQLERASIFNVRIG